MNILIVDDEKLARDRLARLIEKSEQHTVVGEANNGHAAIEQIEKLQPDIVLLDIRMPGMDGLEVARHLTKLENPPAIIFCTAYSEHALKRSKRKRLATFEAGKIRTTARGTQYCHAPKPRAVVANFCSQHFCFRCDTAEENSKPPAHQRQHAPRLGVGTHHRSALFYCRSQIRHGVSHQRRIVD